MLNRYETILILKSEATDEMILEYVTKFEEIIKKFEGKLILKDDWGKLKLAFEVKGFSKGRFIYIQYEGIGGVVTEVERNLKNIDAIIRFLTVRLEENYDYNEIKSRLDYLNTKKRNVFNESESEHLETV